MSAKVYCFASAKGGSGKTSIVATFGTFISRLDKRTLLIDADFATNGLTLFHLRDVKVHSDKSKNNQRSPIALCDLTGSDTQPDLVAIAPGLDLLPATFELHPRTKQSEELSDQVLPKIIADLRANYDYILIDAQAGSDEMSQLVMSRTISDEVVIVTEFDPISAAGVERLKGLFRDDLTYERTWILLNKVLPEFAKKLSHFMEIAKYLSPIQWDASVVRAYARGTLAINSDDGADHTISVMYAVRSLFGEELRVEIENWTREQAAVVRQPIESQYTDLEVELETLVRLRQRQVNRPDMDRLIATLGASLVMGYLTPVILRFVGVRVPIIDEAWLLLWLMAGIAGLMFQPEYGRWALEKLGLFGVDRARGQLEEIRYQDRLSYLRDRLRRLEALRDMDAEAVLARKGTIADELGGVHGSR